MKKLSISVIAFTIATVLTSCTVLPASHETGVGPEEYAEIKSAEEIKSENDGLKTKVLDLEKEIEKMEKDYLELSKNNESIISKLDEAESKLEVLENDGIPKLSSEKTDKNSIVTYLNNNKSLLEKNLRGIELIKSSYENKVLFHTIGYGDSFKQIFIWNIGESEPVLVDGASFSRDGNLSWINERFLLINTGSDDEYKILDADNASISNTFYSKEIPYLISDTAHIIILKPDSNTFVLYDFIDFSEQEIELDYKNKYNSYKVHEEDNIITFMGVYADDDGITYSINAEVVLDKLKEKYNIVSLEDSIEIKESESVESEATVTEETEEVTEGNKEDDI